MSLNHLIVSTDPIAPFLNIGCNSLVTNNLTVNDNIVIGENLTIDGNLVVQGTSNLNGNMVIPAPSTATIGGISLGAGGINIPNGANYFYKANKILQLSYGINPNYAITSGNDYTKPLALFYYPGSNNYFPLSGVSVNMNGFGNTSVTVTVANMTGVISGATPPFLGQLTTTIAGTSGWVNVNGLVSTVPTGGSLIGVFVFATEGGGNVAQAYSIAALYG